MQGETVSRSDLIYTSMIISGSALAVAFASHEEQSYTLDQLFGFFGATTFRLYITGIIFLLIGAVYNIKRMERIQRVYGDDSEEYTSVLKLHRFSYASISGIAGAQSVLFAKLIVSLVMNWINGGESLFLNGYRLVTFLIIF